MNSRPRSRSNLHPFLSTAGLFAGSALTMAVLISARPRLTGSPSAWRGDDVAMGTAWLIAIGCAAWLAVTTFACLCALARGKHATALRIAAFAPPLARRVLQAALVTTVVLLPTAAYAASPPAPVVLHVGASGRLTTLTETLPDAEVPVVRAPRSPTPTLAAPTTTVPATTVAATTVPTTTVPTTPVGVPTREPARPTTPPVAPMKPAAPTDRVAPARTVPDRTYVVRAGDNLWRIADVHVSRANGKPASDDLIAPYWQRLIAANRTTLRSGNPSLIFPGEVIALPLD